MHPPSTQLALKAFDANAAFNAALAEFQKGPPEATIIAEPQRAAAHGFSWFARPSEPGFFEVRLRHAGGGEISAEGESITALLAGLLGHPLAQDIAAPAAAQAAEPEQEAAPFATAATPQAAAEVQSPPPQPITGPAGLVGGSFVFPATAQAAAESLAVATGGAVAKEEPDEAERMRLAVPLTDEQKVVCVDMIKALTPDQRKAFTIAFRHSFSVSREAKAIAPMLTEVRHMEFCDRWSIENAGGVAP